MAFNGKWRLVENTGGEAFHNAIKTRDEAKQQLKGISEGIKTNPNFYIEELTVDKAANTVHRIVWINGEKKKDSGVITCGAEVDGETVDKRPAKVKLVIDSDTKVTRTENGDGFSTVTTFEVNGNDMTVTNSGNGASSVNKFKRC